MASPVQRLWLAGEFLVLMFLVPSLVPWGIWSWNPIFLLGPVGLLPVLWLLLRSDLPRENLYRLPDFRRQLLEILALFLLGGAALTAVVSWFLPPEMRFSLPRQHTGLWVRLMVLYPLLSVYPQELYFRGFFFQRYRPLFRSAVSLLLASTIAFAYVHVVYQNWVSPVLCVGGGLLFGYRYLKTRSLLLVSMEHALWGMLILSLGLHRYFLTPTSLLLGARTPAPQ